jgi:hypothetical protein
MSLSQIWSTFKLLHLSQPAGARPLYRAVRGRPIRKVLEVHLGDARRTYQLIAWLRQQGNEGPLRYAAIDLFEMAEHPQLELKAFHQSLSKRGVKSLPIPGTLAQGLPRAANAIGTVDLAIFDVPAEELQQGSVQSLLPRVLGSETLVLCRTADEAGLVVTDQLRAYTAPQRQAA